MVIFHIEKEPHGAHDTVSTSSCLLKKVEKLEENQYISDVSISCKRTTLVFCVSLAQFITK